MKRRGSVLLRRVVPTLALAGGLAGASGAGLVWYWARRALPQTDGQARLPGLSAAVVVRRDRHGVPHIDAASIADAVRAQGYVTAQDRAWQMDLLRRRALGELSEAFGPGALAIDKDARTLGLGHAARDALALVSADAGLLLEAYAAGVNAFLEAHAGALPLEFRLLRYRPRAWTPVDTLAVGKLLALDLAQGWDGEAFRVLLEARLAPDVLELLYPLRFPDDRILFASDAPEATAAAGGGAAEPTRGSNNWVVSGAHTATGRPLLANDPHLNLGVPSTWAAVHLRAPGLDVAGVALPGTPGVTLGRNRRVAWGCTNVHDDSADLYVEEFDPRRPDHYRVGDGWERVSVREEPIRVRRSPLGASWRIEPHRVRATRHGPIVELHGRLYALRWTALERAEELSAFVMMNRAGSWPEFSAALRAFPGPSQNFVYADVDGHIAWYSAGRLPIRRSGDGSRPYPGASDAGDWLGYVPFEELPHLLDPPEGRIVTANNRLAGTRYPHKVTRGGIGPWRAAAISEALEARRGWTTDEMARLQGERLSIPHRDLAVALRAAAQRHAGEPAWSDVTRELAAWDGRLEADSRAAAWVVTAGRCLGDRVIGPRVAGLPQAQRLRQRTAALHTLVREQPAAWLPAGDADWDATLLAAWRAAEEQLGTQLGPDRSRWHWGALNRVQVRHPLSLAVPALGRLLDPAATEFGGGPASPNVLSIGQNGVEGPSMRFVANLADPDDTRLVNFMGQSGHVASSHYADQFGPWLRVESQRLVMTREAVEREARHTLRLVP